MYKAYVINKLQRYMSVKDSNDKMLEDIEYLKTKLTNITGSYGLKAGHTTSSPDGKTLNILSEIELKRANYDDNSKLIEDVEFALDGLDPMSIDVVLHIYGTRSKDKRDLEAMESKYNYTQRNLYRKANDALVHISYRMLGDC